MVLPRLTRLLLVCFLLLSLFQVTVAHAQVAVLDALQKQIDDLRKKQSVAKKQFLSDFLTRITAAAQDPDQAVQLYDEALAAANGGEATGKPGKHKHTEKAEDEQTFATMVQAHCGLVRFAALYILLPDSPHLDADWKSWLASAGTNYPLLGMNELRDKSVQDSVITKYFNLDLSNKDQSDWAISQLPDLFEKFILKPLGAAHDPRVLPAWDTYGAMLQFDQARDPERWNNVTLPTLSFRKAMADYEINPSAEKLKNLYNLAQQYPAHPDFDKWIDQISTLLSAMKAKYTGSPSVTPPSSTH